MSEISIIDILQDPDILEPETLDTLFPDMSDIEKQRVQVLKLLKNSDVIFEDMDVFENAVLVINDINPDITKTEGASPEYIWYTLDVIDKMRHGKEFSNEVIEYIKFIFIDNGYKFFPPSLGIDNKINFKDVIYLAEKGPFPLPETVEGIQAARYLYIQEYLKIKNGSNS